MIARQFGIDVKHKVQKDDYVEVTLTMSLANLAKLTDNTSREYSAYFTAHRERIKAEIKPESIEVLIGQPPLPGL